MSWKSTEEILGALREDAAVEYREEEILSKGNGKVLIG